jgi:hypothetical protein
MSRSKRKTPIFGNCGWNRSEKQDKQLSNRKLRRKIKEQLATEDEFEVIFTIKDVSNVYDFAHDGKHWWSNHDEKSMRK